MSEMRCTHAGVAPRRLLGFAAAMLCIGLYSSAAASTPAAPVGGGCDLTALTDCFIDNGTPGCNEPCIEASVCAVDPFCCSVSWDSLCAGEAATVGVPCDTDGDGTPDVCEPPPCDLPGLTDCFMDNGTPGCNEPCIEASVCAVDPFCCSVSWDSLCAGEAATVGVPCDTDGDGIPDVCDPPDPCDLTVLTDCFMDNGSPGCNEPCIEAAVCAIDPFCCSVTWDSLCAGEASFPGVAPCDTDGDGIPDVCDPPDPCDLTVLTDCFMDNGSPGCNEPCIEAAVCAIDPFCCSVTWDSLCAGEASFPGVAPCDTDGDGIPDVCEPPAPCDLTVLTDCFIPNGTPGCNEPCIEASVCAVDPFCCSVSWDSLCAGEAATVGVPCDCDADGDPDVCEEDCNGNGIPDDCELAVETVRVGTPANPAAFLPGVSGGPVIGSTWDPVIDHSTFLPGAILDFVGISATSTNFPSAFGTILCGVSPAVVATGPPGVAFALPIGDLCSYIGLSLCVQGGSIDSATVGLANALDITIGG